jgi:hypothetical protein
MMGTHRCSCVVPAVAAETSGTRFLTIAIPTVETVGFDIPSLPGRTCLDAACPYRERTCLDVTSLGRERTVIGPEGRHITAQCFSTG